MHEGKKPNNQLYEIWPSKSTKNFNFQDQTKHETTEVKNVRKLHSLIDGN
jgi:hypothetical protein